VEPKRLERKEEVVAQFELQRDAAQLAAAKSRFELGDLPGCRETLEPLLQRNPQHAEAQKLLTTVEQRESTMTGTAAPAKWEELSGSVPKVARVSAALPIVDIPATDPEHDRPSQACHCALGSGTYACATDRANASLCAGPPSPDGQQRLPVYRSDTSSYDGGARTDVARRSVYQAIEALAIGDEEGARMYYRASAAAEPDNVDLRLAAAAMLLRYEQYELALEMAQSAQSIRPGDAAPYRTLGTIHYRQGDYQGAFVALSRAISLDKAHPLSYFLMGSALRKLGEIDKADWHFQQAATLDPRFATRR